MNGISQYQLLGMPSQGMAAYLTHIEKRELLQTGLKNMCRRPAFTLGLKL